MAALTQERITPGSGKAGRVYDRPQTGGTTCYAGALIVLDSTGNAEPGTTSTTVIAQGRCEKTSVNPGASGAVTVRVREGAFWYDNSSAGDTIAQANVGGVCYVVDDHTVALTSGTNTRSIAGQVLDVDATLGVLVLIGMKGHGV